MAHVTYADTAHARNEFKTFYTGVSETKRSAYSVEAKIICGRKLIIHYLYHERDSSLALSYNSNVCYYQFNAIVAF